MLVKCLTQKIGGIIMKNLKLIILFVIMTLFLSSSIVYADENLGEQLFQADPTIFAYGDKYYLYGTNEADASKGYKVFESDDLIHWTSPDGENDRYVLNKGDAFGTTGFWAPQVFLYEGTYYMAYTANEQIAIAKSDSPIGPFTQSDKQALLKNTSNKSIDPFVYFDDDGQVYLYYVELNGGNNICVAKMKDDLSGIVEGTKKECIKARKQWENTNNASWPVAEGPTVIKRNGTYYLFYSANDFRNPDYAVGYATSSSPMGPWKKSNSPLISKNELKINGTGHGDIFTGPNNELYYVLHTHNSNSKPTPRRTATVKLDYTPNVEGIGTFSVDVNSFSYLEQYPYVEVVEEEPAKDKETDQENENPKTKDFRLILGISLIVVVILSCLAVVLIKLKKRPM